MAREQAIGLILAMTAAVAVAKADRAGADRAAIADQFAKLTDPEPAVRAAARVGLMGLTVEELSVLRDLIQGGPVRPAQADALGPIVIHVLARDALQRLPRQRQGFMGVSLSSSVNADILIIQGDPTPADLPPGVSVAYCMTGFVAARFLEDGDLITGFTIDARTVDVHTPEDLMSVVGRCAAGTPVVVHLRRNGQSLDAAITLDARPFVNGATPIEQAMRLRDEAMHAEADAQAAFERDFAPLLKH